MAALDGNNKRENHDLQIHNTDKQYDENNMPERSDQRNTRTAMLREQRGHTFLKETKNAN